MSLVMFNLKAAIETIDAAIERFEANAEYHLLRGRILLEQHKLDAANKALIRSIELDPTNAEPHYFIGILYQRWSDDASALASYKKAMECNETHPQFLLAAAESYVALGQMEEAIALFKEEYPEDAGILAKGFDFEGNIERAEYDRREFAKSCFIAECFWKNRDRLPFISFVFSDTK